MRFRPLATLGSIAALALVTACSTPMRNDNVSAAPVSTYMGTQYGRVASIEAVPVASHNSAGGAVLGAVIGGLIGNQIGSGTGRAAATGAGVIGGAVVGNQISRRNDPAGEIYRVSVRFDDGSIGQFDYQRIEDLRVGDRVRAEGGQLYRG